MNGNLSIPLTTATISLALLILVNLAAVIWTSAVLSARVVALTDRTDDLGQSQREHSGKLAEMGERIAALESRERRRRVNRIAGREEDDHE